VSCASTTYPQASQDLVTEMSSNPDDALRMLASILLRQILVSGKESAWSKMNAESHAGGESKTHRNGKLQQRWCAVRGVLLRVLAAETIMAARRKVVHVIAQVALASAFYSVGDGSPPRFVLPEAWPELMSSLGTLLSSGDAGSKLLGLHMAQSLLETVGDPLASAWASSLLPMLRSMLMTPDSMASALGAARVAAMLIRVLNAPDADPDAAMTAAAKAAAAARVGGVEGTAELSKAVAAKPSEAVMTMQSQLLGPLISVVRGSLGTASAEDDARHVIQDLIDVVRVKPTFVRPALADLTGLMVAATGADMLDEATRINALELLITIVEFAGGMLRKQPELIDSILAAACSRMVALEENPEWALQENELSCFSHDGDEAEDALLSFAGESLDRISCSMGGKVFFPRLMAIVAPWFEHPDWRYRRAACFAVGVSAEGSKQFLLKSFVDLVKMISQRYADPHPRVRFAAMIATSQLIDDFASMPKGHKNFQALTHKWLLPLLLKASERASMAATPEAESCGGAAPAQERVRQMCFHALQSFFHPEYCKRSMVNPPTPIMSTLFEALRDGSLGTRQEALVSLSSLAGVLGDDFAAFYDTFMPIAKALVGEASAGGERMAVLRNRALECAGAMCSVVPREKCLGDAGSIMDMLKTVRFDSLEGDASDSFQYFGLACAHLARAMGPYFGPYLPVVMPQLVKTAVQDVPVMFEDLDIDQKDKYRDEARGARDYMLSESGMNTQSTAVVFVPGIGQRKIIVDGEKLQQKASAATVIYHVLQNVGDAAVPMIDQIADAVLSCVGQQSSELCRTMGVTTCPIIVHVAGRDPGRPTHGSEMLTLVLRALFEAWKVENSDSVMNTIAEAIAECFRISARSGSPRRVLLSDKVLADVVIELAAQLSQSLERWKDTALAYHDDEDFDARKGEMLMEALSVEKECMGNIVDTIGQILAAHGPSSLAHLGEHIFPVTRGMVDQTVDPVLSMVGICVFDELVENGGDAVAAVLPIFIPPLARGMSSDDPELRQACAFGAGLVGKNIGAAASPYLKTLVPALIACIELPDAKHESMSNATDNAVASLVRILEARAGELGAAGVRHIVSKVLPRIPMVIDAIEARYVHKWFVDRLVEASPALLGDSGEFSGPVLVLLSALCRAHLQSTAEDEQEALMDGATGASVSRAAAAVAAKFPAAASSLTPDQAAFLRPEFAPTLVAASAHVDNAVATTAADWVMPSTTAIVRD
jgi:importin-5